MSSRLKQLRGVLGSLQVQRKGSTFGEWLHIGDAKVLATRPASPELVPRLYAIQPFSQTTLQHLKWMLQKDSLGQDMFLIGHPGPSRRLLAMCFCELTQREVEYVSLSRDTTETDLKQRREIIHSTVHYVDQSAVRAVLGGRVLVLDGIEKAERNVLPVLNNLLENREMQLDDGRLIVAPERYDALIVEHGEDTLLKWKITRASEKFRVIALGLPVPPYKGNPLDPPLRSRFQARTIFQSPYQTQVEELKQMHPSVDEKMVSAIVSVSTALHSLSQTQMAGGPVDLSHQLPHILHNLVKIPSSCPAQIFQSVYPSELLGTDTLLKDALQKFGLSQTSGSQLLVSGVSSSSENNITLEMSDGETNSSLFPGKGPLRHMVNVPGWHERSEGVESVSGYVATQDHEATLAQMMLSHQSADFCLVGGKGTGKTSLVNRFASILGYEVEPITLYQDMSSRELVQQRSTTESGDTSWRISPLVEAALKGRLAVLDGMHRVDTGTLSILKSLIQDRTLNLMDGTRLLDSKRYEEAKAAATLSDSDMSERKIFPIHPKFRLVGVGETLKSSGGTGVSTLSLASWISAEMLSMFQFHHVRPLPSQQEREVLLSKVPGFEESQLDTMLQFVNFLRSSQDPTLQSLAGSVSTRQLLRIAKRLSSHPTESLYQTINKACLSRFLPPMTRSALHQALANAGIKPPGVAQLSQHQLQPIQCETKDGYLRIGETTVAVDSRTDAAAMVPDVLFYDNQLHLEILEDMLKDYLLGEHLLLVGNQGVGKNKIVDRFLHLLNLPREYLQLHRDSTVQTLTLQPSVQSGRVTYQDSPLVRALEHGMVLVVDEADKAPTHVTCILKNIIEGSEITLADGRRIMHQGHASGNRNSSGHIFVHPNFRMIVLANRPGFPFLGNDFFASLGDIFSCHAVDNPDLQSEKAMLRQYGGSVEDSILTKLVSAFSELRRMADDGLIAYPYSTREVVNIVKHIEAYPEEGIGSVVRNVFDFDSYNPELLEVVLKVLHKHGIPAGADRTNIQLAPQYPLSKPKLEGKWSKQASCLEKIALSNLRLSVKGPYTLKCASVPVERIDSRGFSFSEMKSYCTLPLHETNHVSSLSSTCDSAGTQYLHMLTASPVLLYSLPVYGSEVTCVSLDDFFPSTGGLGFWSPSLSMFPLTGSHADKILIHERKSDTLLLGKPLQNCFWKVGKSSLSRSVRDMISWRQATSDNTEYRLCASQDNMFASFKENSPEISFLDFSCDPATGLSLALPESVMLENLFPLTKDQWLLIAKESQECDKFYILDGVRTAPRLCELRVDGSISPRAVLSLSRGGVSEELFQQEALESNSILSNSLIAAASSASRNISALILRNLPFQHSEKVEVYSVSAGDSDTSPVVVGETAPLIVPSIGEILYPSTVKFKDNLLKAEPGLVVVDLPRQTWRKMILPPSTNPKSLHRQKPVIHLTALDDSTVAAVDSWGTLRIIETGLGSIHSSLEQWQKMVGEENRELQVTYLRDSGLDVSSPKHGKVDEKNAPHVGGNTWAGGTGGRDTAGLGGKGGPYRLDAGHNVHQLSDEEKNSIPEDVKRKAREMGLKARRERLREIEMSEHDAEMYSKILSKVKTQVQALRIMLSGIESKNKERQWIRHQTSGDLDERKLIDGITGERSIYKRRGEKEPDFNSEQVFPTCIRLVVDVSGSMYRFNGYDGRLDRTVEAMLMVMEACQKLQNYKVDIVGHSGDSDEVPFMNSSSPPSNDKERLQILKSMIAESQFCWSGDHTIEATRTAINKVAEVKAEQRYVIVLSDANFSRYGIKPADFAKLMVSNPLVNVYAIFIGSLGDQAVRLKDALPAGTSYICMENKNLPNILKAILSSIN